MHIQLSKAQIKELDRRKKNYLSGKSRSYTLEETEKMIKDRKK